MRPRVFPAEDTGAIFNPPVVPQSFNEAAGIPRGRRRDRQLVPLGPIHASMRPRVFPAEDFMSSQRFNLPASMLQ